MTSTLNEKLGNRLGPKLARIRTERGYSQEFVAKRLDVHVETISRFERGTAIPTLLRLFELADVLGVSVAELLLDPSTPSMDMALEIASQLEPLSPDDRIFVKRWLEEMCKHLVKLRHPRKKAS